MALDVALLVLFDWVLPMGRCIGVHLHVDESDSEPLPPDPPIVLSRESREERALAAHAPPRRRASWIAGRFAMRIALTRAEIPAPAVAHDERGAPLLPQGIAGSISHKEVRGSGVLAGGVSCERGDVIAVAIVQREEAARLGVDVEFDRIPNGDLASHVLTRDEESAIAGMDAEARARETVLRFSAKEALYKAIDPFVRRYVGFDEVAVDTHPMVRPTWRGISLRSTEMAASSPVSSGDESMGSW